MERISQEMVYSTKSGPIGVVIDGHKTMLCAINFHEWNLFGIDYSDYPNRWSDSPNSYYDVILDSLAQGYEVYRFKSVKELLRWMTKK